MDVGCFSNEKQPCSCHELNMNWTHEKTSADIIQICCQCMTVFLCPEKKKKPKLTRFPSLKKELRSCWEIDMQRNTDDYVNIISSAELQEPKKRPWIRTWGSEEYSCSPCKKIWSLPVQMVFIYNVPTASKTFTTTCYCYRLKHCLFCIHILSFVVFAQISNQ